MSVLRIQTSAVPVSVSTWWAVIAASAPMATNPLQACVSVRVQLSPLSLILSVSLSVWARFFSFWVCVRLFSLCVQMLTSVNVSRVVMEHARTLWAPTTASVTLDSSCRTTMTASVHTFKHTPYNKHTHAYTPHVTVLNHTELNKSRTREGKNVSSQHHD